MTLPPCPHRAVCRYGLSCAKKKIVLSEADAEVYCRAMCCPEEKA